MIIYLDYVFFINFLFDFILLISVAVLLKRNVKFYRIIIGSLFGGFTIFSLFFNISSFYFFFVKMILGIIMVIITFNFKDVKYTFDNFFYLVIISIILGGTLYLINDSFSFSNNGLAFFSNGKKFNIFILLLFGILILFLYIKMIKKFKIDYSTKYEVNLYYDNKCLKLNGFLDTGNMLCDPYLNKPILIINKGFSCGKRCLYVPVNTISGKGLMKCFIIDKVCIVGKGDFYNVLVGVSLNKFSISGIDIILNKKLWEDI